MWDELLTAVALVLVVEGVLPFLSPADFRRAVALIGRMDKLTLRIGGLISMALGVALLYVLKN